MNLPVCLKSADESAVSLITVSLGGGDRDGFVQLLPVDPVRASNSIFWEKSNPVVHDCRALVRSPDAPHALLRGMELYEHLADRLTLLFGYPIQVLTVGFVYNEDMLKRCIAGEISEYAVTTSGESTFRTQPPKNAHLGVLLAPPQAALEAIRWFRHAMVSPRKIEQYLYYYIALESIAKHIPGVTRGPRYSSSGDKIEGKKESAESAGIRHLVSRYPNFPSNAKQILAEVRGRIAHGNTDVSTLDLVKKNLPALQRLVADGIALVYGIEPSSFNVQAPNPIDLIAPMGRAKYSPDSNPCSKWGGLLSDAFDQYIESMKRFRPSDSSAPQDASHSGAPTS